MPKTAQPSTPPFRPIAIIGISAIFPGSVTPEGLWLNIVQGRDLIRDIPETHWLIKDYYDPNPGQQDKTYCKRGGFLDPMDFDPIEFGVPPNVVPATDTAQLLGLIAAKAVLNDATQGKYAEMDLSRVSVILGSAALEAIQYTSARLQRPIWTKALRESGMDEAAISQICDSIEKSYTPWQENTFPGLLSNVVAGRIANRFNLGGSNYITDAACAGSLAALSSAINELQLGLADWVITGGVDALNDILMYMCFSKTGALSAINDCRPFSDKSDGTVLGEGLGMVALKRLEDAEKDGDTIYAVIRGVGSSSDGRSKSIYAPVAKGQSQAILRAYEAAGIKPSTVELIEAHGTGTKAGDIAEFQGLKLAFGTDAAVKTESCALGTIKSQFGHTKAAAGSAGLLKAVLALHHKTLPPTIKIERPHPELDIHHSPFYLNTEARPWVRDNEHPRRAGVSSFGFGGSNFHVMVEEYTGKNKKPARFRTLSSELLLFTGKDANDVLVKAQETLANIADKASLVALAKQTQLAFLASHPARLAIVADSVDELRRKLSQAIKTIQLDPQKNVSLEQGIYYTASITAEPIAFIFNGLGTEHLKMGQSLLTSFDAAMAAWDNAAGTLSYKLHTIIFPPAAFTPSQKEANETRCHDPVAALPALVTHAKAHLNLLDALGIKATTNLGHAFGQAIALCETDGIPASDLLKFAEHYGKALSEAQKNQPLVSLEVIYPVADLISQLKKAALDVTCTSTNSPNHSILSGTADAIHAVTTLLDKHGTRYHPVTHKSQQPLAENKTLQSLLQKEIDSIFAKSTKANRQKLLQSFLEAVDFNAQIEACYNQGIRTFVEVGASGRLTHYIQQILTNRPHTTIQLDRPDADAANTLWHGLSKMITAGANLKFDALWENVHVPSQEKVSPKHALKINGTNYGKPYPVLGKEQSIPAKIHTTVPKNATVASANKNATNLLTERDPAMSYNNPQTLQMLHEMQRQLVDAHAAYQRAITDSHMTFMNTMNQLAAQTSGTVPMMPMQQQPAFAPVMAAPVQHFAPAPQPVMQQAPAPVFTAPKAPEWTPPPVAPVAAPQPVAAAPAPSKPAPAAGGRTDLQAALIEVIVDKTGYPAEMLNMEMAIEADLGIDSIKRVEILSALSEKIPNLPEVNPNDLGQIVLLGDILNYMKKHQPA